MRSYVPAYHAVAPRTLSDALKLLADEPGQWTPLAGGTDVMVLFEAGQLQARKLMSLTAVRELRGIAVGKDHVDVGALATYSDVQRDATLRAEFPSLVQASAETGGLAIQNRGTLGGNIANASPAADSPPALLVAGAQLRLVSAKGERWLPYEQFHLGYKKTALRPDELIATVRLPRAPGRKHFYRKVGTRKAQAISKVVFAGSAELTGGKLHDVRLALGSVAPTTVRCPKTEALLRGQAPSQVLANTAIQQLAQEIAPIDDIRSTAAFRMTVAGNVLRQWLLSMEPRA